VLFPLYISFLRCLDEKPLSLTHFVFRELLRLFVSSDPGIYIYIYIYIFALPSRMVQPYVMIVARVLHVYRYWLASVL